jgi:hypothetical protein
MFHKETDQVLPLVDFMLIVEWRAQPVIQIFVSGSTAGDIDLLIDIVHIQIIPGNIVNLAFFGMPEIVFLNVLYLSCFILSL